MKTINSHNNTERNLGIDLLRLVLMYMVCMLHTLNQGGILSVTAEWTNKLAHGVFLFLSIFSYCAVDGFAIISGYTSDNKPARWNKIVEMWFQAFFYSFIITLVLAFAGINVDWSAREVIKSMMPVTSVSFWYFTAYFGLFFSIPFLNKFLFTIDLGTAKKAFIIMLILYSIMGTISDPFQTHIGYSYVWLMILYCLGVIAKRIKLFEKKSSATLLLVWFICLVITWIVNIRGYIYLTNYVSPTILLSGLIMVILFSRIQVGHTLGTIIRWLSPLAFGIYLLQTNKVIWYSILDGAFSNVAKMPFCVGICLTFVYAALLFIIGLGVECVRKKLAAILRIPDLSVRIVKATDNFVTKCTGFFN